MAQRRMKPPNGPAQMVPTADVDRMRKEGWAIAKLPPGRKTALRKRNEAQEAKENEEAEARKRRDNKAKAEREAAELAEFGRLKAKYGTDTETQERALLLELLRKYPQQ